MQIDNLTNSQVSEVFQRFDIEIDNVNASSFTLDSRKIKVGSIFFAVQGTQKNGREFIEQAIDNGACLVVAESENNDKHGLVNFFHGIQVVEFFDLSSTLGKLANALLNDEPASLPVIAVTGTNGKTSVAHLTASLSAILGKTSATIGTVGLNRYSNSNITQLLHSINTTPDPLETHKHLATLSRSGVERVCIEASSHGLDQNRLQGLSIKTAIFTNLTRDHLDYHKSMTSYAQAKRKLIIEQSVKYVVINIDDPESVNWIREVNGSQSICVYSCAEKVTESKTYSYLWATDICINETGCHFKLQSTWGEASINLPLFGEFNVNNLLASMAALLMEGESFNALCAAAAELRGVPGRMELFKSSDRANLIVDFAHTPDALEQALNAAKQHCIGKLYVVFGCGGNRDASKRKLMGEVAEKYADIIWLTQDNSRFEDPEKIIADILLGISNQQKVYIELDRKKAIQQAFNASVCSDLVLVAGKGHEQYLEIAGERKHYNERDYIYKLLTPETPL